MNRRGRTALFAIFSLLLVGVLTGPARADDLQDQRNRAEKQQAATDRRLAELRNTLDETGVALADAFVALKTIEARLPQAQQELVTARKVLATAEQDAAQIQDRLLAAQALETQLGQQVTAGEASAKHTHDAIAELARQAYRGDASVSSLTIVLDSRSAGDFIDQYSALTTALRTQTRALDDLQQLGAVNRNRQARLAAVRNQISGLKKQADQKVVVAENARKDAVARQAEIQSLRVQQKQKTVFLTAAEGRGAQG